MTGNRDKRRLLMREEWARLRTAALTKLEQRGYDVRGKTPKQIRQILKRRRKSAGVCGLAEPRDDL